MINRLIERGQPVEVQDTSFTTDVMGRYICSTWDEAVNNGGVMFDAVVIGAGMFGAYCAEKIYRNANLRVLVLDAGSFLVSEHVQNFGPHRTQCWPDDSSGLEQPRSWATKSRLGLTLEKPGRISGSRLLPRRPISLLGRLVTSADRCGFSQLAARGCPVSQWPTITMAVRSCRCFWLPPPPAPLADFSDGYEAVEKETGVFDKTDYISGPLNAELTKQFTAVFKSVPTLDAIEEAPLAVQAAPPASGLFSFDKYSSAPILADAIREAASNPDWRRRLFLVPRAHVVKLHTTGDTVTQIEVYVNGQQKFLTVTPMCAVVLASSTIEATRLAMTSFPTPSDGTKSHGTFAQQHRRAHQTRRL